MKSPGESPDNRQIIGHLKSLEQRISRIEAELNISSSAATAGDSLPPLISSSITDRSESLELHIGEYWLSKSGILIFIMGLAFLLTLPYDSFPGYAPSLLGYLIVAGVFLLSRKLQENYDVISRYLVGGGLVLLYFAMARLHFFGAEPFVGNRLVEIVLLLAVTAFSLRVSLQRQSVYLAALSLSMGYLTAMLSENPYMLFVLITLLALVTVYFKVRYQWQGLLIFGIVASYLSHFFWFINNPMLGNPLELQTSPHANLFFILLYALIFAAGIYRGIEERAEDNLTIIGTFLNLMGAYGLYLVMTVTSFPAYLSLQHLLASTLFLALAVLFWTRIKSRYITFLYAMTAYGSLSVAIINQFGNPDFFMWLCWQSLLVISTAIWFRSKFIIVANFIIYVLLFIAYMIIAGNVGAIGLSFGVVALLSARILNWQKDKLELKTDRMREAYLAAAFVMFPYALYQMVPGSYVSLSWVVITIGYYIISKLLDNNTKYRWLALLTLLLTVIRVFAVDMTNLDPNYRVASFLVLGIVLLISSTIYTRMRRKSHSEAAEKPAQQDE